MIEGDISLEGSFQPGEIEPVQITPNMGAMEGGGRALRPPPAAGLPLDYQSRMSRAREMGFDPESVWYHGTSVPKNFTKFDPDKKGKAVDFPAVFLTNQPALAGDYASMGRLTGQKPLTQQYSYGQYKAEIQDPIRTELSKVGEERIRRVLDTNSNVEHILSGNYPLDDLKTLGVPSDSIVRIKAIRDKYNMNEAGSNIVEGARILPLLKRGNYSTVSMFEGFNEWLWDAALRGAREAGLDGVHFKGVVDSPTGKGEPGDILAVFDPANLRSTAAKFDPGKTLSPKLNR
jgi:hypothetical protein